MGARALALADVLRAAGLPVVEVPGWQSRGRDLVAIRGGVTHHTATSPAAGGDYPTLGVVRDGRAGLAGPLSQLGLGRSGTWYVIAAGRANHAGTVHSRYASTHGNPYSLGVEAEHPGGNHPWPAVQYASYVRGCAAIARHYGITWLGHKEVAAPVGRKPDPTFDMGAFRASLGVALVSNPGAGGGGILPNIPGLAPLNPISPWEDDMALSAAGLAQIKTEAHNALVGVMRSPEFRNIVRDAVLEARLDQGVGSVREAIRDSRVISRRTEEAVRALLPAPQPGEDPGADAGGSGA